MSTEPKELEDVFAFIAANPDKLAKAQRPIPARFHIYARNESRMVCKITALFTATMWVPEVKQKRGWSMDAPSPVRDAPVRLGREHRASEWMLAFLLQATEFYNIRIHLVHLNQSCPNWMLPGWSDSGSMSSQQHVGRSAGSASLFLHFVNHFRGGEVAHSTVGLLYLPLNGLKCLNTVADGNNTPSWGWGGWKNSKEAQSQSSRINAATAWYF